MFTGFGSAVWDIVLYGIIFPNNEKAKIYICTLLSLVPGKVNRVPFAF